MRDLPVLLAGGLGVIKTAAVQEIAFNGEENKQLPKGLIPRTDLEVKPGDLLITRTGPRARAGVCCLVRAIRPRLMICDKVYRFRAEPSRATPEFLVMALNTPEAHAELDTMKTGISDSGVNLTQNKFLSMRIGLPSIEEQREIARRVEALFKVADAIEKHVATATARADKITQAVLAKAFRGELVPTEAELAREEGREYEPASVLLERIAKERATSGPKEPKKRPKRDAA